MNSIIKIKGITYVILKEMADDLPFNKRRLYLAKPKGKLAYFTVEKTNGFIFEPTTFMGVKREDIK